MTTLLAGNGRFDYRAHTGRVEYEAVADRLTIPSEGVRLDCLAVIVLDDHHVIDHGNGVAAGVMLAGGPPIPAGWFKWQDARAYREQLPALAPDETNGVIALGRLIGGAEYRFSKGIKRLSLSLWLDLEWPIRRHPDWFSAAAPLLRSMGKL